MAPADDVASQTPADAQHPILRAQLAIEPQPESNCLVLRKGGDATEIKHHRKQPSPNTGGQEDPEKECCDECHAELTFSETEPSRREYVTTSVEADCICPVFDDHDCIPDIRDIRAHSIIVVVTVPSRSALQALIQDLSATAASLSVDWLVMGEDDEMTTEIDVSSITPKQREALWHLRLVDRHRPRRHRDFGCRARLQGPPLSANCADCGSPDGHCVDDGGG